MIKLVSSWTNPGGSTVALIDLCNLFNKHGMHAVLHGTADFPTGKCKYKKIKSIDDLNISYTDKVIIHNIIPQSRLPAGKVILSMHEKHSLPIANELASGKKFNFDKIHFITEEQRKWHCIFPDESFVIGNYINLGFTLDGKHPTGCAGVIGTIEPRKRTFESVQKAILDGYNKVILFGTGNETYINTIMTAFRGKVDYRGYEKDKKTIYSSIDKVYHLSRWEIACLVQGECKILGIPFEGSEFCPDYPIWSENEVISAWKEQLQ